MKKQILLTALFVFLFMDFINAQITIELKYSILIKSNDTIVIKLNESDIMNLSAVSNQKLILYITDLTPKSLKDNWTFLTRTSKVQNKEKKVSFDITDEVINKIGHETSKTIKLYENDKYYIIKITWTNIKDPKETNLNNKKIKGRDEVLQSFKMNESYIKPYNIKKGRIDLFFDENGRLLNFLPVNVDQSDDFYLHILSKVEDDERYRINIVEGLYSPVDLSIRTSEKTNYAIPNSTNSPGSTPDIGYESKTLQAGPFTSDNFSFQIAFDSINGRTFNGPAYTIKINKLYHVGVGVSIVNTWLENPNFRIAPLGDGTNTIESYNNGPRTFFTFNVMWYWTVLQQQKAGSVITKGRDILKDEPTWSLNRVFPTIGVSLDNKLSENFFAGIVCEFGRGGSIILGIHYGRVQELSDKAFILNKTVFTGTNEDIRINNVFIPRFFIGVNVDTRIFNALFTRGQ